MEISKSLILLCCTTLCIASHHGGHVIPIEGYETELQNLGEHVEIPETPVKVIKITKTVAVKVPVPYPVKVYEKVPYPVHVNKPYPVPVPQIIRVPYDQHGPQVAHGHEALDVGHNGQFHNQNNENSYQVQENQQDVPNYGDTINNVYEHNSGNGNNFNAEASHGDFYGQPSQEYHEPLNDHDQNTFESKNYDLAIQNYLNRMNHRNH
ncbi:uncharacterized protein LOC116765335 [Danaus plexippus]|uniref:uncharacterized protein LOC116765335 n=1 Tax=Danaus plexippus TaxID=13037 RepID=UPI002AB0911C|nr:uncharacterized protein LOC116765335 [Danaus plexippus]